MDQRFVRRSPTSPADHAIVRTVREPAHRLGLHAVAEGVETAEPYDRMRDDGFDLVQGYHLSRPLSEPDLVAFAMATPTAPRRGRWTPSPAGGD